jgi:hypothetical protein
MFSRISEKSSAGEGKPHLTPSTKGRAISSSEGKYNFIETKVVNLA